MRLIIITEDDGHSNSTIPFIGNVLRSDAYSEHMNAAGNIGLKFIKHTHTCITHKCIIIIQDIITYQLIHKLMFLSLCN